MKFRIPKKVLATLAAFAAVAGISTAVIASFGPDRPTFTLANPATYVTFNSITDNTTVMGGSGDERAFSTGAIDGANAWSDPVVNAKDSNEITVRAYVHNNAKADLNLVAENVTFKAEIPSTVEKVHQIKSTINSSNANPTSVFDTLDISAENGYFSQLEYVPGSAKFTNNVYTNGVALSDSIVTTGATLGYNALDGKIPGCLNFSGWVTFKVKVKVPAYEVAKTARISGEGADKWRESVNIAPGDKVDYRIEFINNGNTPLKNIRIYDKLPTYMRVVPGTVKLIDGANPASNPYVYPAAAVTENGTKIDVLLNNSYPAQSNAFIRFQAEVVDNDTTRCGTVKFSNIAYAHPTEVEGIVNDGADVYLVTNKTCTQPENPVYKCEDVKIEKLGARKVRVSVTAKGTPANRVSIKNYEYNYGDGKTPLVTDKNSTEYTYDKDGTYKVSVKTNFVVDGKDQAVAGAECEEVVTFTTTPTTLPNTGAGSTIGMFLISTVIGFVIYRAYAMRKV